MMCVVCVCSTACVVMGRCVGFCLFPPVIPVYIGMSLGLRQECGLVYLCSIVHSYWGTGPHRGGFVFVFLRNMDLCMCEWVYCAARDNNMHLC